MPITVHIVVKSTNFHVQRLTNPDLIIVIKINTHVIHPLYSISSLTKMIVMIRNIGTILFNL